MKFPSLERSRSTVAVMSRSFSVIGSALRDRAMLLKTFQHQKYCGPPRLFQCGDATAPSEIFKRLPPLAL
jgi:hypothetical protein